MVAKAVRSRCALSAVAARCACQPTALGPRCPSMQLHMICVLPLLTTACQARRLRISVPLVECLVDGQKYLLPDDLPPCWIAAVKRAGQFHHRTSRARGGPSGMAGRDQGADTSGRTGRRDDVCRIGVMQALNHGQVRELRETGKKHHWGRRKLERDSLIHILDLKADQLRTRRALPRILPYSLRRNAEATFDLA